MDEVSWTQLTSWIETSYSLINGEVKNMSGRYLFFVYKINWMSHQVLAW